MAIIKSGIRKIEKNYETQAGGLNGRSRRCYPVTAPFQFPVKHGWTKDKNKHYLHR